MIYLTFLPVNQAWVWTFFGTTVRLDGEPMFFATKKEARAAYRRVYGETK